MQVWTLWFTLNYLYQKAHDGSATVSATELRQAVLDQLPEDHVKREHIRDEIINILAGAKAIVRTNVNGFRSRRYFLTEQLGRLMMQAYWVYLIDREDEKPVA